MAALMLTVAFIGMIEAVTVSSKMMDSARRQTLGYEIINHEIEKLRFASWTTINGLAAGPTNIGLDSQFNTAISSSGATYSLSRSVADVVKAAACGKSPLP